MWGNNGGWGNQGGFGFQPAGFQQPGFSVNLGGGLLNMGIGMGTGFNRWANPGFNYQSMNGYNFVDYSGGWNASYHDQLLRNNIDMVYQRYDMNFSGQLEGNQFFYAYRDLCLMMGMAPPMDYNTVWGAMMQCDQNFNGRVSKMQMFMVFKRLQGIGMNMNNGWGF